MLIKLGNAKIQARRAPDTRLARHLADYSTASAVIDCEIILQVP